MPSVTPMEQEFIADLLLALVAGLIIGGERELKRKPAGISTHAHVIAGAMMFTFLSRIFDPAEPTRIAAQIVSGVGFLGAGIILKQETTGRVTNLTTAASIWYSAAVGMAIGFGYYMAAVLATVFAVLVSRIPKIAKDE